MVVNGGSAVSIERKAPTKEIERLDQYATPKTIYRKLQGRERVDCLSYCSSFAILKHQDTSTAGTSNVGRPAKRQDRRSLPAVPGAMRLGGA